VRSPTIFAMRSRETSRTASPAQSLLELETASARLKEETRILNRETELLRDLLVRLRERGERPELN